MFPMGKPPFTTSDVFGSLSSLNTQVYPRLSLLLIVLGFPEEFGDNPP